MIRSERFRDPEVAKARQAELEAMAALRQAQHGEKPDKRRLAELREQRNAAARARRLAERSAPKAADLSPEATQPTPAMGVAGARHGTRVEAGPALAKALGFDGAIAGVLAAEGARGLLTRLVVALVATADRAADEAERCRRYAAAGIVASALASTDPREAAA